MANATVNRIGQVNGAGDADALFLKVFGGEVMTAFEESNVAQDKHMVRSIANGKSAQFPATWKVSASYHTPGAEIVGQTSNVNERVITIDDLLISDVFLANIDEAKSHYDVRSIYTQEAGRALAREWDKNVLQLGVLAARASATVTGGNGGTVLTNASYGTDGATLAGGMFAGAQKLDEKDIPENDRYMFIKPAQYYLMAQTTNVLNRDWGGSGVYAEGSVLKVAGISIVKTNNLPTSDLSADTPAKYAGNFATTVGLIMNKMAVGTVKLLDLAVESQYDIRRQGTLVVAKYALGSGILRPECAVELKTA
jgi:hypothetical protein